MRYYIMAVLRALSELKHSLYNLKTLAHLKDYRLRISTIFIIKTNLTHIIQKT